MGGGACSLFELKRRGFSASWMISIGGQRRPFHKENIRWDITPILVVELSMVGKEFFL